MRNTIKMLGLALTIGVMICGSPALAQEEKQSYWGAISICDDGAGLVSTRQETREWAEAVVLKGGQIAQLANSRLATPCKTEAAQWPDFLAAVHCSQHDGVAIVREESFIGRGLRPITDALEKAVLARYQFDASGHILLDDDRQPIIVKGFAYTDCTIQTWADPTSAHPAWRTPHYK